MKTARAVEQGYQLKISLDEIHPPIWRRVLVSSGVSLGDLHEIIQEAMGWTDSHLHMFEVGGRRFSDPDSGPEGVEDEGKVRLRDVAPKAGDSFAYEYDMGDGWRHAVVVENVAPADDLLKGLAVCQAGARACPPEDCGGPGGYEDFLVAIRDPAHEEHENMLEWIGRPFDPEAFDLPKVNKALKKLK